MSGRTAERGVVSVMDAPAAVGAFLIAGVDYPSEEERSPMRSRPGLGGKQHRG